VKYGDAEPPDFQRAATRTPEVVRRDGAKI